MKTYTLIFLLLTQLSALIAQDGMLDISFGIDGIVKTDISNASNDVVKSLVVQPDNKIIVAGYTTDTINRPCLVRYNIDGSKDNSFGMNGVAITYFSAMDNIRAFVIALQQDGKIVAGGHSNQGFAMLRFNSDGSLDDSFGDMGVVTTSILTNSAVAKTIEIQQDGKIVLGGSVLNSPPDGFAFALARYNEDGALDSSFGTDGITITDITAGAGLMALDFLNDLALQEDGKIVAAGVSGPGCVLVRYNSDGSLDDDFGVNGIVTQNFSNSGNSLYNALAIQQDGKIIAAGFSTDTYSDFLVTKYDSSGNLDNTFGTGGIVNSPISPLQDGATSLLLQADNKIIAGGSSVVNDINQFTLVRYTPEGNLDSTFGVDGVVTTVAASNSSIIESMAFQADGKILAAGSNNTILDSDYIITRYTSELVLSTDNTFLQGATLVYPNPSHDYASIDYYINDASNISIELFGLHGKLVKVIAKDIYKNKGLNKEIIQMQELANGVYFISISTADGNEFIKLVKN